MQEWQECIMVKKVKRGWTCDKDKANMTSGGQLISLAWPCLFHHNDHAALVYLISTLILMASCSQHFCPRNLSLCILKTSYKWCVHKLQNQGCSYTLWKGKERRTRFSFFFFFYHLLQMVFKALCISHVLSSPVTIKNRTLIYLLLCHLYQGQFW